jgi:hypothetical protein
MKITIDIPDHATEAVIAALQDILDQITPTKLEPTPMLFYYLQVNGKYLTNDRREAHCTDIRRGFYICVIDGEEYAFWADGEPAYIPNHPTYRGKIVEKITH